MARLASLVRAGCYPFPAELIPAARLAGRAWTPPQAVAASRTDGIGPDSACRVPRSDFGPPCRSGNAARGTRNEQDAIRVGRRGSRLIPHSHFRVPRSAGPGAAHWHDPAHDAARYRTLATLDYHFVLTLTDSEIEHAPQWAAARIAAFLTDPARTGDPTRELLPQAG